MEKFDFQKNTPFKNFEILFKEAEDKKLPEANAMSLATVDVQNKPSVRVVLLKGMSEEGFVFYTNYKGKKAQDLDNNKFVSANFFWPQLEKQVRIQGFAEKVSRAESEAYFKTRPRESQIGAWASSQSEEIPNFDFLQEKFKKIELQYENKEVPCPPHWGGYVIKPQLIEFWFGRMGRMHERYVYTQNGSEWKRSYKSP